MTTDTSKEVERIARELCIRAGREPDEEKSYMGVFWPVWAEFKQEAERILDWSKP